MSIALTPQESGFFQKRLDALPIYTALRQELDGFPGLAVQVQKTQISFYKPRMFACVSFLAPRPKREMPPCWLTVSFGLGYPLEEPRIAGCVQISPRRWTHHVPVAAPDQVDAQLMGWLREACAL